MFFTKEKVDRYIKDLKEFIYQSSVEIEEFEFKKGTLSEDYQLDFADSAWETFRVGNRWGGKGEIFWFRSQIKIPSDWKKDKVALVFDPGHKEGESRVEVLLYVNGSPVQGLDSNHREVILNRKWVQAEELNIVLKAFSGLQEEDHLFKEAKIVNINEQAEDFYYRGSTLLQAVETFRKGSIDYERSLNFLNQAINLLDFRTPGSSLFYESIEKANDFLKKKLSEYNLGFKSRPVVTAIGHSHLDVAWLWRLCHTREKCSRTFSNVLKLMEGYPEFKYLQSSPQLYEYIKEDYPAIFNKIKEKIQTGDWEVTGGMWVEADCNIPSGESLVRQFLCI